MFGVVLPMIGVATLALVSGLLIGCIGIGGVLLVPCLSLVGGDVHAAIGARLFSFIFSAALGGPRLDRLAVCGMPRGGRDPGSVFWCRFGRAYQRGGLAAPDRYYRGVRGLARAAPAKGQS